MNCMLEKEKAASEGIGFYANMDDWAFTNFSVSYCLQFMQVLQGKIPVRVRMFLIVNPPGWFDKIWKIMKPMLAPEFRKKVHILPEAEIGPFLKQGYQAFLPDDTKSGKAPTDQLVADFIAYRKSVEAK